MLRHELFALARVAAAVQRPFPVVSPVLATAGRARWTFTALVASVSGTGATVTYEAAATSDAADSAWRSLGTVAVTAAGSTPTTVTVQPYDAFLRARITAANATTPDAIVGVTAAAAFFDSALASDLGLLSKSVREHQEVARFAARAEDLILALITRRQTDSVTGVLYDPLLTSGSARTGLTSLTSLTGIAARWLPDVVESPYAADLAEARAGRPGTPTLDIDLSIPGVLDALRAEIAAQVEHLARRERLGQSPEPSAAVTLRQTPELALGAGALLAPYRRTAASVWRGR